MRETQPSRLFPLTLLTVTRNASGALELQINAHYADVFDPSSAHQHFSPLSEKEQKKAHAGTHLYIKAGRTQEYNYVMRERELACTSTTLTHQLIGNFHITSRVIYERSRHLTTTDV